MLKTHISKATPSRQGVKQPEEALGKRLFSISGWTS
jgi:hypothetical protein